MNYDFMSLSPEDFERLMRDLLSKEWGAQIEAFKSGRDGGIDLRHSRAPGRPQTIVQCKRYQTGNIKGLLTSLKDELPKIKKLEPHRYVLATSVPLSPSDKDKILEVLKPWCKGSEDIFGADEINGMLTRHPSVERAHFKLWIASTTVLERVLHAKIFNLADDTMEQIREQISKLVVHDGLDAALKILHESHHVLIVGNPGIGKTTLARMLVCRYVADGYEPLFVDGHIGDVWSVIDRAKVGDQRFVVVYDDFLGQVRFGDSKFGKNEDKTLLQFLEKVRRAKNIRLILTTREYILADAQRMYGLLDQKHNEIEKFTLKLADYKEWQRARVLFNHLYFSDLPDSRLKLFVASKTYRELIKHDNFNPRIVETICKVSNTRTMSDKEFIKYVTQEFDNPSKLWEHPFHHQIAIASQQLLAVLWSFGGSASHIDLQAAFMLINSTDAPELASQKLKGALKELDGNFIRTSQISKKPNGADYVTWVTFDNPSVSDFIERVMHSDDIRLQSVVSNIISFDQFNFLSSIATPTKYRSAPALKMAPATMRMLWEGGRKTFSKPGTNFVDYFVNNEIKPVFDDVGKIVLSRRYEVLLRTARQLDLPHSEFADIYSEIATDAGWKRIMEKITVGRYEAQSVVSLIDWLMDNLCFLELQSATIEAAFTNVATDFLIGKYRDDFSVRGVEQLARGLTRFKSPVDPQIFNALNSAVIYLANELLDWEDNPDNLEEEASAVRDIAKLLELQTPALRLLANELDKKAESLREQEQYMADEDLNDIKYASENDNSNFDELFATLAER
jgi:DNA polymerase III delta prime subunit